MQMQRLILKIDVIETTTITITITQQGTINEQRQSYLKVIAIRRVVRRGVWRCDRKSPTDT